MKKCNQDAAKLSKSFLELDLYQELKVTASAVSLETPLFLIWLSQNPQLYKCNTESLECSFNTRTEKKGQNFVL